MKLLALIKERKVEEFAEKLPRVNKRLTPILKTGKPCTLIVEIKSLENMEKFGVSPKDVERFILIDI